MKMAVAAIIGSVLGFAVAAMAFPELNATMHLNTIGFAPILVNLILCVSLLWMQTTAEEILFRCPFLRAAGGDKITPTARVAVAGVFSCLLFMLVHFQNPEVGS